MWNLTDNLKHMQYDPDLRVYYLQLENTRLSSNFYLICVRRHNIQDNLLNVGMCILHEYEY